jgi:BlaI family transcriptional regulator, penicillinase repressor
MSNPTGPTNAELEILGLLWQNGPQTVKQVHEIIRATRDVGYTTVLKLMQLMAEKGLLTRDETERSHVYRAAVAEKKIKRKLVSELLDRAFDGSAAGLVQQLLSAKRASAEELDEIRAILDEHAKQRGDR